MSTSYKKLNNTELAAFFTQIAMLIGSEDPSTIMAIMLEDTKNPSGRDLLEAIKEICDDRQPLYAAMEQTQAFPDYAVRMMELGRTVSKEQEMAQSLADYYERQETITEGVKNAVSYPMIMIFMMLLVIIVLITKVLPIFNQVFKQLGSQMNSFSVSLMKFGDRLSSSSIILVVLLCLILLAFIFFSKVPKGKELFAKFLTVFPPTKKFYTAIDRSRFASSFAMVYGNIPDTYEALDMSASLLATDEMKEKVEKCKDYLAEGKRMEEALNEASIFSSFHSRMVAIGFDASTPAKALNKIADDYDKEVDKRIHDIIAVLEPTLVIILSLIVGMILLSVILPLMGIMSSIG